MVLPKAPLLPLARCARVAGLTVQPWWAAAAMSAAAAELTAAGIP